LERAFDKNVLARIEASALAKHQGVRRPVRDVRDANGTVDVENAVLGHARSEEGNLARIATIAVGSEVERLAAGRPSRLFGANVRRTQVGFNDGRAGRGGRIAIS